MAKFDPYLEWLGIPVTERPPTLYQLLGVDPSITDSGKVKLLAIQQIAKVRHFQRGEYGDVCAWLLEELSAAEATLTNPARRAQYDVQLAEAAVRLKPIDESSKQAQSPALAARSFTERATPAKVIAVPATIPTTPAPKRTKRSSRRNRNALTVKWIIAASVGVVVLIGGVVANRMMSKPNMATTPSADVPVPEIAVAKVEPKPQPAPVVAVKPITAVYRPIPNDAVAAITFGRGTLGHRAPDYMVETDAAGLAAGIEVTFSKPGYLPHKFRVTDRDVSSTAPIEVVMEVEKLRTGKLIVTPPDAVVAALNIEATRINDNGEWSVSALSRSVPVTVSAPGFVSKTIDLALEGPTTSVTLIGSRREAVEYYQNLGKDSALRMVGRLGSFGSGVGRLAFSQNGKYLAVAEGSSDANVHVWDVAAGTFIGEVMHTHAVPAKRIFAPAESIAVSNDGRFVAVSFTALVVFDVATGEQTFRIGDQYAFSGGGVLAVAFTPNNSLLTLLQDGRLLDRDPKSGKVKETLRGPSALEILNMRLSEDGHYATGDAKDGPHLWALKGKNTGILFANEKRYEKRVWCGRPGDEYFAISSAPGESDTQTFLRSENETPPSRAGFEIRDYEAPGVVVKRFKEPSLVHAIEVLSPELVAVAVQRDLANGNAMKQRQEGDFGLRIWNVAKNRVLGEAFLPLRIYRLISSNDGKYLAAVTAREQEVHVWKVNPRGVLPEKYLETLKWEPLPLRRWEGSRWWDDDEAKRPKERMILSEDGAGKWILDEGGKVTPLQEVCWRARSVVLSDGKIEFHFFNNGNCWKKPARLGENHTGYERHPAPDGNIGSELRQGWKEVYRGAWTESSLPVRRSK